MSYGIIYKATNLINSKIYIGQTIKTLQERKTNHKWTYKNSHYKFHKAIKKYGWENFVFEKLDDAEDADMLSKKEKYYIAKLNCIEYGYNSTFRTSHKTFTQTNEFRKKFSKISDEEASVVKCLYENEKLTQVEIFRLTNISSAVIRNIVLNISYNWVKSSKHHPYTKEQIQKVKQETLDIQKELNENRPSQSTETKLKKTKFSDETISHILWFLENTDLTSPELSKMFNYSNMSDLRNNKTRTWVKASKSVSKELLDKAEKIKKKRSKNDLNYKISIVKKIMNDKLLNQSQCAKIVGISQPLISIIVLNKDHVDIKPIDNLPSNILKKITEHQEVNL